ncbi:MAG: hypothetical protein GF401_16975 [Chitinivibrionales bacterium]|nr:hypothetical protein [Chitinivibrionales bacterium]
MEETKEEIKVRKIVIVFCALIMLFSLGCQKKEKKIQTAAVSNELQNEEFTPPADSTVTKAQLEKWLECNPLLDSLSFHYQDSFKTENAAERIRHQEDFAKAQDKICVRAGLKGGYEEYLWILQNSGNPKNKDVLDSLQITIK